MTTFVSTFCHVAFPLAKIVNLCLNTVLCNVEPMDRLKEFLSSLGLKDKESNVYLAALQYGSQTASVLARKTDMPRSTMNFELNTLVRKGFVSKDIREKTTYFNALPPECIENILLGKAASVKKSINDFKEIFPILNDMQGQVNPMTKVQYFEGIESLCRLIDDDINDNVGGLYLSGHNNMHPKIREYLKRVYVPSLKNRDGRNQMIIKDGEMAREYTSWVKDYEDVIFADPEIFKMKYTIAIYGNKVAFCSYDPSDLCGIIIENSLITNGMRAMFEVMKNSIKTL